MTAPDCPPTQTPQDIDLPALREKYRREREKRLRPEGSRQYIELVDDFAGYYESDPYTPPPDRAPISADIDVLVLGGGFGGLLCGAYLKKAGVDDVRIIELGGDFGGVWYWNRYPGLQCDNESYCYVPLLEELNYIPSKKFADGTEIYEHCRRIGKHYGLYDSAIFSTQVRALRWDDEIKRWRVGTNRDDDLRARFVVMASGPFHRPKLPGIPGIKDFRGTAFTVPAGTTTTPAATATVGWSTFATSESGWWAPGRPPSRSCRTWAGMPSTSTSFSAPRHPWARATMCLPTLRG
ncbi:hypothetical protein NIIDMKKI_73580 [Mycobacterium kansasii]|uniref:Pyridine nucleotide-disulfide oxidoreductase family protein n=1 Tax=Mycobacterium kansasii TaxID=1768 RepID=A0A7G1IPS6_MYCKA|nr:hypothetical protein NIIDMKKI_73580 [Mycobacterium kansasii]